MALSNSFLFDLYHQELIYNFYCLFDDLLVGMGENLSEKFKEVGGDEIGNKVRVS